MTQVTIEIDNVPEGYRAVAFRQVKQGEWYLGTTGRASKWKWDMSCASNDRYLILQPVLRLQSGKFYVDEDGKVVQVINRTGKHIVQWVSSDGDRLYDKNGEAIWTTVPLSNHKSLVREATQIEALRHLAETHGLGQIELGTIALGQEFKVKVICQGRTSTLTGARLHSVSPDELAFDIGVNGTVSW